MKELPLPLNGPMVRAVRDGRKTQTRRPFGIQPCSSWVFSGLLDDGQAVFNAVAGDDTGHVKSPFGAPGDLLWVRETFLYHPRGEGYVQYRADDSVCVNSPYGGMRSVPQIGGYDLPGWRPSIHMPKWAARLWLRVLRVWVERVQDISAVDVFDEGIGFEFDGRWCCYEMDTARREFFKLWDSIYAARGMGRIDNPLVWACEFEVVT